jgi:two-component system, LytTR family, sensor histidine kinase AlgZ
VHPILSNRRRLAIYLLAWLLAGVLLAVGLRRDLSWLTAVGFFLPLGLAYAFVTLSAWYVCRAFPVGVRARTLNLVVVHVLAAALASTVWLGLAGVWATLIDRVAGDLGVQLLYQEQQPLFFVVGVLLFWLAAVFHYLLIAFEASREAETRALESSLLAREAELKALRAQIDPHFIFNSLHSISALTAVDPPAARRMCLLLADFLRETLRLGSNARIPLADELALADRFLAIEQVRLGARLQVARDADPQAATCLVPPLLLQPLVENAVVHGVSQLVDGGTIRVAARRAGSVLTITLENPCDPDRRRTRGVGLGLELLRKRLMADFGTYDALKAVEESGLFRVEVRLPVITDG